MEPPIYRLRDPHGLRVNRLLHFYKRTIEYNNIVTLDMYKLYYGISYY